MKRFVISLTLLGLICLGGVWNTAHLKELTDELGNLLAQAEASAITGEWEEASRLTGLAFRQWEEHQRYFFIMVQHDQIEEVEAGFEAVKAYIHYQETPEYTSANETLMTQLEHIWAAERFSWENLL